MSDITCLTYTSQQCYFLILLTVLNIICGSKLNFKISIKGYITYHFFSNVTFIICNWYYNLLIEFTMSIFKLTGKHFLTKNFVVSKN